MDLYDAIRKRRSVRAFTPSEIADDAITRIVDAGRLAPSGCNLQTRHFIVIRHPKTLAALQEKIQPDFVNAAAAIAVVIDPLGTEWGTYFVEDAAAATENILLATVAEGYDSVWVQGTMKPHEEWVKELLSIPADKMVFALLPIGKAAAEGSQAPKAPLDELMHQEHYPS